MRVVLDTNVLISALISPSGAADRIYRALRARDFDLVSSKSSLPKYDGSRGVRRCGT